MDINMIEVPQQQPNNFLNLFKNKKLVIILSICLILFIVAITVSAFVWKNLSLKNNYSKEIALITIKVENIKEKINPQNLENMKIMEANDYFSGLENVLNLERDLEFINNNPQYKKIEHKVSQHELGIDEIVKKVQELQKDNDNIRILLQKNKDLDVDISNLGDFKIDDSIDEKDFEYDYHYDYGLSDYSENANGLIEKQNKIKYDALSLSVNSDYRKMMASFIEAQNHRLKYLQIAKNLCDSKINVYRLQRSIGYDNESANSERANAKKGDILNMYVGWASNSEMSANTAQMRINEKNREIEKLKAQSDYEMAKYEQLVRGGDEPTVPVVKPYTGLSSAEEIKIINFYNDYAKAMVLAINYNDFSLVEKYFKQGSNLYNSQVSLVKSLNEQNIKEEFLGCTISEILETKNKGEFSFKVIERYHIITNKIKEYKEQSYTYTLVKSNGYKLTEIK